MTWPRGHGRIIVTAIHVNCGARGACVFYLACELAHHLGC